MVKGSSFPGPLFISTRPHNQADVHRAGRKPMRYRLPHSRATLKNTTPGSKRLPLHTPAIKSLGESTGWVMGPATPRASPRPKPASPWASTRNRSRSAPNPTKNPSPPRPPAKAPLPAPSGRASAKPPPPASTTNQKLFFSSPLPPFLRTARAARRPVRQFKIIPKTR